MWRERGNRLAQKIRKASDEILQDSQGSKQGNSKGYGTWAGGKTSASTSASSLGTHPFGSPSSQQSDGDVLIPVPAAIPGTPPIMGWNEVVDWARSMRNASGCHQSAQPQGNN
jgi:hypothetical protein